MLIVNTALSKLLNQQQQILLNQQHILEGQTRSLAEQNEQILKQQVLLEEQQKEINKANQGLMDAKGVTQEQAQQLVGCVKRVTEAENKIGEANATLLAEIEQRVAQSASDFAQQLQSGLVEQGRQHEILEQVMAANHAAEQRRVEAIQQSLAQEQQLSHQQLLAEIEQNRVALFDSVKTTANQCDALEQGLTQAVDRQTNTDNVVAALQTQFVQSRTRHRFALAAMACVVGLSVGWQILQHFSLF